jgi:glycine/D-amino acid oxidase-like deaminating enzyme
LTFAADYAAECYWALDADLPAPAVAPLPASADVLVIGSGYTGLAAARETALAGRSTVVLDAGPIGGGCSSRNGGQVAFSIKPAHAALAARHGATVADRIYGEALEAIEALRQLAREAGVDCDWRDAGGYYGAHTRRHFNAIVREAGQQPAAFAIPYQVVPPARQADEIDSPLYHGGLVFPGDAAVHPLKLVVALHARAAAAGVACHAHCAVESLARVPGGFEVQTARGVVRARQVLVATNGYTGTFSPWHRRRVLPIGSYIIATEPLDPALVRRLIPAGRNVGDTRHVVIYLRPSPDGRRILFGGRAAAAETDVTRCVPRLRAMLAEVFPSLARVAVSRAWMGFVGFTFDTLPHVGERDGLFHCMGYCGQGIPLATYYGRKIGLTMAGRPGGATALTGLDFPSRPYYTGRPWFLPAAVLGYRLRDALGL